MIKLLTILILTILPLNSFAGYNFGDPKKAKYIIPNVFISRNHCKFYSNNGIWRDDKNNIYYVKNKDLNDRCTHYPFIKETDIIWRKYKN